MQRSELIYSRTELVAENGMVVGGHQAEADAGVRLLMEGGNAIDAMVGAAFVAFVVEPASCGIGGYGRLSIFLAEQQEFVTIDHYVRAPLKAHASMFALDTDTPWHYYGHPKTKGRQAERGYLSPAVPGAVAGLCLAHKEFGQLPLAQVLAPAIEIAEAGVPVYWRLSLTISNLLNQIKQQSHLSDFLLRDGAPLKYQSSWQQGERLDTSDLAKTLKRIAGKGPAGFYTGPIAEAIEREVTSNGGILSAADLGAYKPKMLREKPCQYRGLDYITAYDQVGYEALNILDHFDLRGYGPDSVEYRHLVAEALGIAFIDNKVHYGDPEFENSPVNGLTSREFAASRAATIKMDQAAARPIVPADPWPYDDQAYEPETIPTAPTIAQIKGTTQVVSADKAGNFCSLITSLSSGFGCQVMVPGTGIILNNSMQNFDPRPGHPNDIKPGKIPIFAAPALLSAQNGQANFAGAGSGGYRIMTGVLHSFMNKVDHKMGMQAAVDAPRVHCQGQETIVDSRIPTEVQDQLRALGHEVVLAEEGPGQNNFGRVVNIWRDLETGLFHAGSGPGDDTGSAGY